MTTTYTTYDQLPITLNADEVATVLGISRARAYTLMRSADFHASHRKTDVCTQG